MFYYDILEGFFRKEIKYLIVGGLSVNLYGVPRVTQDIDVIISLDSENISKTISLLKDLGYLPKLPVNPEDLLDAKKVEDWIANRNMKAFSFYHHSEIYKEVDIVLVHPLDFEKSYENKTAKKIMNIDIYIAPIDDIIKMKETSGRAQDVSDANMLKKVKEILDSKYG